MESAIAPHLRCARSFPKKIGDDFQPPVPAWTARSDPATKQVVMAYFGIQWRSTDTEAARSAIEMIADQLKKFLGESAPERAHFVDSAGYENLIQIVYWTDIATYQRFANEPAFKDWWESFDRETDSIGIFREIFWPRTSHLETLISTSDQLDGVAEVFGSRSEQEVQEHSYWGSMRDRLPAAQTDNLLSVGQLGIKFSPERPKRIRVNGHDNLTIIRSGQDWSSTTGSERESYGSDMEPTLRAGMDFLSEHGGGIGCYSNRYVRICDRDGCAKERSFGLSYWSSLDRLEGWAENHPTHVAIFDGFMNIVRSLNGKISLRLYHEVVVIGPDECLIEYVNCHPGTGLLAMTIA